MIVLPREENAHAGVIEREVDADALKREVGGITSKAGGNKQIEETLVA